MAHPAYGSSSNIGSQSAEDTIPTSTVTTILSLPFDILHAIFIVCHADDPTKFRITASHVCRQWRSTAIQSSTLWSTIQFTEERPPWEKYEIWLERSREAPLTIEVQAAPFVRSSVKTLRRLLNLIVPHSRRWASITLSSVPEKILRIAVDRIRVLPLPILHTIFLSMSFAAENKPRWKPTLFTHGTPALRQLTLEWTPLNPASPIISNLTSLTIYDGRDGTAPPLAEFRSLVRSLLARSPKLHTLRIRQSSVRLANDTASTPQSQPSSPPLVHHGLQIIDIAQGSTITNFLTEVHAPALIEIQSDHKLAKSPLSVLPAFARWPTLSSLIILVLYQPQGVIDSGLSLRYLPAALGVLSALEKLYFQGVHFDGDRRLECLGRLCPQLTSLVLVNCTRLTGVDLKELVAARLGSATVVALRTLEVVNLEVPVDSEMINALGYQFVARHLYYKWSRNDVKE